MKFKKNTTLRGFSRLEFCDANGEQCSIQKSSACERDYIWLGVDDAKPQVLHGDAHRLGVNTDATCGWVPYPIPEEVLLTTRMHLTRKQAKALAEKLEEFALSGEVK